MSQITVPLGTHNDVQVVTPAIFDSQNIKYGDISLNSAGGKELYLKYGDGLFLFQTPRLRCPFGVGITENPERDGKPASKSYRLAMSFGGYNDPKDRFYEKKRDFHDMMSQIDDALIAKGRENSLAWIKLKPQAANEDVIRALFNPSVRHPTAKDGQETNYPPTMNANILSYDGKFSTEIYDADGTLITDPEAALGKGCEVKCLIQAQKVTFPQGKFGVKYNILNMKVWPSKGGLRGRGCMIDDDSDQE
jgi:hypothetical protein